MYIYYNILYIFFCRPLIPRPDIKPLRSVQAATLHHAGSVLQACVRINRRISAVGRPNSWNKYKRICTSTNVRADINDLETYLFYHRFSKLLRNVLRCLAFGFQTLKLGTVLRFRESEYSGKFSLALEMSRRTQTVRYTEEINREARAKRSTPSAMQGAANTDFVGVIDHEPGACNNRPRAWGLKPWM